MNNEVTIEFPHSQVRMFSFKKHHPHLRVGQAFYNHMQLHKIVSPANRKFCDKLWNTDGEAAWAMIRERTDYRS